MEFLSDYGLFLLKAITIVIAILFLLAAIARSSQGSEIKGNLVITDLSDQFDRQSKSVSDSFAEMQVKQKQTKIARMIKFFNKLLVNNKDSDVAKGEIEKQQEQKGTVIVLHFKGDVKARQLNSLRQEISAILAMKNAPERVLIKLTSPGGLVYSYGLASSQIARLRDVGIPITVCVDTVAASGGYMMAVVADEIVAAPFAILGSIGVVAQIPNISRFLKNRDIDIELHTAGTNKRTLTVFGENTPEGRRKFKQDLDQTHVLFKKWITEKRPALDIESVSDGSVFYGTDALERGLIDRISTSDDVILNLCKTHHLVGFKWHEKKSLAARLGRDLGHTLTDQFNQFLNRDTHDFTRL